MNAADSNPRTVAVYVNRQSGEAWPYQGVHVSCNGIIVMDGDNLIFACLSCGETGAMLQTLMTERSHRTFTDILQNPDSYNKEYWDFSRAKPYFGGQTRP